MSVGVVLSDEDLQAVRNIYSGKFYANIKNWKERDTDYCLWIVQSVDDKGRYVTETGHSLAETIAKVLSK